MRQADTTVPSESIPIRAPDGPWYRRLWTAMADRQSGARCAGSQRRGSLDQRETDTRFIWSMLGVIAVAIYVILLGS